MADKVYGWTGNTRARALHAEFPDTDHWKRQTREIVAAKSRAAVGRIADEDPRNLQNLTETRNAIEIELAMSEPGVVFWKPLDAPKDNRWVRDERSGE